MKKIVNERKIKHWAGYGSVDAKLLKKTPDEMVVQVSGMHERGLEIGAWDTYGIYEWLVKRFDPTKTERDIQSVDIDDTYETRGNVDIEVCTYTIHFGRRGMWQESSDATLRDISRTYGPKVAKALEKYCKIKKLDIEKVVTDTKEDANKMTAWDKFDVWAKRVLKLDIMNNFDDTIDWTGVEDDEPKSKKEKPQKQGRFGQVYKAPTDFSTMEESGGSRMEESDILDWIYEEMGQCEWAGDMDFLDDGNAFEVSLPGADGDVFKVSVQKVWSGRLGSRLN